MKHPLPYSDTDPRAMAVWIDLQRQMPAGQKIAAVFGASHLVMRMYEAGVRLQYPGASEREIFLRTAARHLSRELLVRAYGWDPDADASPSI